MGATRSQLELLHARHATSLFSYLYSLVRDRAAAEDLLQEVFLHGLREEEPALLPAAWWFRVARNAALNHIRDRRRRREASAEEGIALAAPESAGPLAASIGREEGIRVREALATLDPEKREAVELHYGLGLACAEVAEIQGVPEGTVKSRCHHGLAALRRMLSVLAPEMER